MTCPPLLLSSVPGPASGSGCIIHTHRPSIIYQCKYLSVICYMYVICIYHYISTYIIFYPHRFDAWNIVLKKKKNMFHAVSSSLRSNASASLPRPGFRETRRIRLRLGRLPVEIWMIYLLSIIHHYTYYWYYIQRYMEIFTLPMLSQKYIPCGKCGELSFCIKRYGPRSIFGI